MAKRPGQKSAAAVAAEKARKQKLYRARKKAEREAETIELAAAEAGERADAATAAEAKATATAEANAKADDAAKARVEQERLADAATAAEKAKRVDGLAVALTAAFEAVTETTQYIFLDGARPHFGPARAAVLGDAWAPILEPHINEETASLIPLAVAAGLTSGQVTAWVREYRAAAPPAVSRATDDEGERE